MLRLATFLLLILTHLSPLLFISTTWAENTLPQNAQDDMEFLPVDQAFQFSSSIDSGDNDNTDGNNNNTIKLRWEIADGYYLYKKRFSFNVIDSNKNKQNLTTDIELPEGTLKNDEYLGEVIVYKNAVEIDVPLSLTQSFSTIASSDASISNSSVSNTPSAKTVDSNMQATLVVRYQGCAEAGLCYPPKTKKVTIPLQKTAPPQRPSPQTNLDNATSLSQFLSTSSFIVIIITFFILGLGLTFTPCVLPMIPILSSIIAGQGNNISTIRAFTLSLAYVLGMALTYSIAGTLVGFFGAKANIQLYMQMPEVLSIFSLLFVLLSLSMFGFYELQLPSSLQNRLNNLNNNLKGGEYFGVAMMGIISALVVSPCVSAPLAGALLYISGTGDAILGGTVLFALAMGMGAPLLAIGTSGGKLLPKAGAWMNGVKTAFGFMLLAVAIWLLQRFIAGPLSLLLWGSLFVFAAVYLGAFSAVTTGWQHFRKALGILFLIYGIMLIIGSTAGEKDPFEPLLFLSHSNAEQKTITQIEKTLFTQKNTLIDINSALNNARKNNTPVMLDFYADWCISCKTMEKDTFSNSNVHNALIDHIVLQADLSDISDETQAIMQHFNILGLPSILFFDKSGEEIVKGRVQGELDANAFIKHVNIEVKRNSGLSPQD